MGGERLLVTGAGGCICAWALRFLLDEGPAVVASDPSRDLRCFEPVSYPSNGHKVDFIALDVASGDEVADPFGSARPVRGRFSEMAPCTQGAWSRTRHELYPLPITASTRRTKVQRVSSTRATGSVRSDCAPSLFMGQAGPGHDFGSDGGDVGRGR